jgi:hypothetical protein
MKKYGIINGETETNPVKTASDKIIEQVSVDSTQITDPPAPEDGAEPSDKGASNNGNERE